MFVSSKTESQSFLFSRTYSNSTANKKWLQKSERKALLSATKDVILLYLEIRTSRTVVNLETNNFFKRYVVIILLFVQVK